MPGRSTADGHDNRMIILFLRESGHAALAAEVDASYYIEYDGPDSYDRWHGDAYTRGETIVAAQLGMARDAWTPYAAEASLIERGLLRDRQSRDLDTARFYLREARSRQTADTIDPRNP